VIPSTFPEDLDKTRFTPSEYVQENARRKAFEVAQKELVSELELSVSYHSSLQMQV